MDGWMDAHIYYVHTHSAQKLNVSRADIECIMQTPDHPKHEKIQEMIASGTCIWFAVARLVLNLLWGHRLVRSWSRVIEEENSCQARPRHRHAGTHSFCLAHWTFEFWTRLLTSLNTVHNQIFSALTGKFASDPSFVSHIQKLQRLRGVF